MTIAGDRPPRYGEKNAPVLTNAQKTPSLTVGRGTGPRQRPIAPTLATVETTGFKNSLP